MEKLMENGADIHPRSSNGGLALYTAIYTFTTGAFRGTLGESEALLQTIRLLLEKGANIYEFDNSGLSMMHLLATGSRPELLNLFIEQAIQLEKHGLHGSVQRLLRFRDDYGLTPVDCATKTVAGYLEDQLRKAEICDGKVMYDFGDPDIEEIQTGLVSKSQLLECLYH